MPWDERGNRKKAAFYKKGSAFKLGSEKRQIRNPETTPFRFGQTQLMGAARSMQNRKDEMLGDGNIAQANMDGTITLDPSVDPNSAFGKKVIKHEAKHLEQIKSGKGTYTDKYVTWKGEKYARKDGKIFYRLKWYDEGDKNLPWEKEAIKAEGGKTKKITDGRAQSAAFQKKKSTKKSNYGF